MCCLIFHLILVWTWSPSGENIWSRLQAESWYLKPLHQLLYTNALCTFLVVAVVPLLLSWCIGMCCCRMQSGERPATVCFSVLSVQPNIWNLCKDLSAEDSGSKQPVHNQLDTRHHLRLTSPQKTFSNRAVHGMHSDLFITILPLGGSGCSHIWELLDSKKSWYFVKRSSTLVFRLLWLMVS